MSMGFFDQSQSNVEKIVEWSLNLMPFCHLHLMSVTSSPTPPPPPHPWLNSCSFFLPLMDQTKLHSPRKTSIKYGSSSLKNTGLLRKILWNLRLHPPPPSPPSPAKEIVFFYSTPKQILNFLNLSLNNSIGPQPGVKDVKCSSLSILLLT